jgi:hypothetical protein
MQINKRHHDYPEMPIAVANRIYYGEFGSFDDVVNGFRIDTKDPFFPREEDILFATYHYYGMYEAAAYVLLRRNDNLFEVYASHCSCYGLEGQWEPEKSSAEVLKASIAANCHQFKNCCESDAVRDIFVRLVDSL